MRSALCSIALVVGLLGACDSGDESSDQSGDPVTIDDLEPALLVDGDLSDRFRTLPAADDDTDDDRPAGPDWGCLTEFQDDLFAAADGDDEKPPYVSVGIKADAEPSTPSVTEDIVLAEKDEHASRALTTIADLVGRCHSVDAFDAGLRVRFTVTSDRVAWAAGSDQQVNVLATGTSTSDGSELPLSIAFSFVRVANVRIMVTFMDFSTEIKQAHREVVDAAVARLRAALDDAEQPGPADVLDDYPIGEGFEKAVAKEKRKG